MTVSYLALYRTPEDPAVFEERYAALASPEWSSAWDDLPGGAGPVTMSAAQPHGAGVPTPG